MTDTVYAQLFEQNPLPIVVSRLEDHIVLALNLRTAEIIDCAPAG